MSALFQVGGGEGLLPDAAALEPAPPPPATVIIREVPVTDALIRRLAEALLLSLDRVDLPEARFHAVVIPDAGEPTTRDFATSAETAAFLRAYENEDVRVRVFYGRACGITRRPHYLVTHEGRQPLFDPAEGGEIDPAGFLGRPAGPAAPPAPGPPGTGPDLDPDDDDGDDLLDPDDDAGAAGDGDDPLEDPETEPP